VHLASVESWERRGSSRDKRLTCWNVHPIPYLQCACHGHSFGGLCENLHSEPNLQIPARWKRQGILCCVTNIGWWFWGWVTSEGARHGAKVGDDGGVGDGSGGVSGDAGTNFVDSMYCMTDILRSGNLLQYGCLELGAARQEGYFSCELSIVFPGSS
jgi:hypothetical protein